MDGGGLHRKRPLIETLEVKGCKMQAADLIPLLACFVNKSFTGTTTPICSLSLAAFIWQIWILGTETVRPKKPKIFYCLAFYRKKFTHCYFRSIMPTWDEISTAPSCPCGCRSVVLLWLGVLENESVSQSCPALLIPLTVASVHRILQARILEGVAIPFSKGSSQPRDWTQVSHTAGRFFIVWATREARMHYNLALFRKMLASAQDFPDNSVG